MSNIKYRETYLSFPGKQSKCSRKRSIYSKSATSISFKYPTRDEPGKRSDLKKENPFKVNRIKIRCDVEADTIGSAVRLTCSTVSIVRPGAGLEEELPDPTFAQDYGTYLKAFALIYVLPEEEWRAENIDRLLAEGEELFHESSEDDHGDEPMHTEQRIKRNFKLENHNFTLELMPPYRSNERLPHIMKNLKLVLKDFFGKAHYCLFLHQAGYLLIWRRQKLYFVMDVKGRRRDDLASVRHGVAMLVSLQTLDNVVHLIGNLSGYHSSSEFTIRELAVVRLVMPDGRIFLRDTNQRSIEYSVINQNYAYLKSSLHLSMNPAEMLRNGSSIIVGVAGILAAHIDHPASWNTSMFDRIICYGVELYRSCFGANVEDRLPIELDKFPTQLRLGQFVAEIKLLPTVCTGKWRCGLLYQGNDFELEIRRILTEHGNALFQINSQVYALWCKDDFYYLLDPYRHIVVCPQPNEDGTICSKGATVRMFRDLLTMLNVFHQLLKESNRHSTFYMHVVSIKNIAECPPGHALRPMPEDTVCNLKQLNETILFPQRLNNCEQLLAENSDFEPDVLSTTADTDDVENDVKKVNRWEGGDGEDWEDCEEHAYKEVQVKVEVIRPARAKLNIHKQTTQTDSLSVSPRSKSNKMKSRRLLTPLSNRVLNTAAKGTNQKKSTKGKEALTSPRRKGRSPPALDLKKNGPAPARKKDFTQKQTRPTEIRLTNTRKDFTANNADAVAKFCKIDAELCAKYRPIQIGQLKIGSCTRCQCYRCPAGQNQTIKKTDMASQTSYHSAPLPELTNGWEKEGLAPEIHYPVYRKYPYNLAVAGSESGTIESLNRLLDAAFTVTNRVLTMTPWGNYVVFKYLTEDNVSQDPHCFYLFDGCTCNIDRFRHLDLSNGTTGLLAFQTQSQVICFMIDSRESRALEILRARLEEPCRGT